MRAARDLDHLNARLEPDVRELLAQILQELHALRSEVAALNRMRTALDAGRAKAIAAKRRKGAAARATVLELADADRRAGRSERGRAGRVARRLGGALSESRVRKILRALSSERDFVGSNGA